MALTLSVLRKLSVAVSTGRVAAVFIENGELIGWKLSRPAARTPKNAAAVVQSWVTGFAPDLMIVENPQTAFRKGKHTKAILSAIAAVFEAAKGLDIQLSRLQVYQDKYDEARTLAKRYPQIAPLLPPKPPIWRSEPRNMGYYEALALAEQLNGKR